MSSEMTLATADGTTEEWRLPDRGRVGMLSLIAAEAAIFVIFIVAYLFYLGKSVSGPTPAILHPPIALSICLLASSATMELALTGLKRGEAGFSAWWILTIVPGRCSWWAPRSIASPRPRRGSDHPQQPFGTTFYSLVGCTGCTVIGVARERVAMLWPVVRSSESTLKVEVLRCTGTVDAVWVVVFTVVYLVGR